MLNNKCITIINDSAIKVGPECGKSAVINNTARAMHNKIRIDNCVVEAGIRADWVIERAHETIVIELKGKNVEHGADQIFETANLWKNKEQRCSKIAGLIIGHQTPAASTSIQLKKQKFSQKYKGPLHIVNKNTSFEFDNIMSFRGPFKS